MASVRRYWNTVELRELRELYPYTSAAALCERFGRSRSALKNIAVKLGLKKSPAFMASAAVRWQPGNRPWNDGKKGWKAGGRSHLTQFKKGHLGGRYRRLGSERRERDGVYVKVAAPNVWKPKARVVWEKNFGPIPDGMIVRLKDGNPDNCAPENLRLIDRREHVLLNWKPRRPAPPPAWTSPLRRTA